MNKPILGCHDNVLHLCLVPLGIGAGWNYLGKQCGLHLGVGGVEDFRVLLLDKTKLK